MTISSTASRLNGATRYGHIFTKIDQWFDIVVGPLAWGTWAACRTRRTTRCSSRSTGGSTSCGSSGGAAPPQRHVKHLTVYPCSPRHPPHSVHVLATSSICSPRHPPHCVQVLAASSTTLFTCARNVIHHAVYRCSPNHPPHRVPVLATSFTTQCNGARHVIHLVC